ncbi:beta family protein, partial [Klebsiella pneumoniae]|uniref:beta family protein n=1 Tax=Klebsiella pneumoniae TaxID=573 RepID=UPI003C6D5B04
TNVVEQEIYERRLFNEIVLAGGARNLIYGDRGSARAEQLPGGSGVIPARIDYPLFDTWKFFRSDEIGFPGYVEQARTLIS